MVTQTIRPIENTIREIDGITHYECFFCKGWFDNPKHSKVFKKDEAVIGYHCCHAISCQKQMDEFIRGD